MKKLDYDTLSMRGRTDKYAAGIRFKAARLYAGVGQGEIAKASNRSISNISNMERARSFPALEAIMHIWNTYRVDPNFILAGHYSQLPADVIPKLMEALDEAISKSDAPPGLAIVQNTRQQPSP